MKVTKRLKTSESSTKKIKVKVSASSEDAEVSDPLDFEESEKAASNEDSSDQDISVTNI